MIIYRVENKDGDGPYIKGFTLMWDNSRQSRETNPSPQEDPTLANAIASQGINVSQFRFGFKTLEQLEQWFSAEELARLKALGFEVKQVQAQLVIEGDSQILFKRAHYET